jgi:flagellin-like protein
MKLFKHKKAISPLISTLILIAIAIAGGLIVYGAMYSWSGTVSSKAQVEVESIDLVKSGSTVTFSITVKNAGNKPITELNVTLNGESSPYTLSLPTGGLAPGQSASHSTSPSGTYVVGNTYTVTIVAKCSDNSLFTKTVSIQCTS